MSTLTLTQNFSTQTLMWAGAGALWSLLRTVALLLVAAVGLAVTFAVVVAFWLPIVQIAGGLAIVAAFGWATYPRTKVVQTCHA